MYKHTVGHTVYKFNSLADLMAKATPLRSGDQLAGIAARSYQERVAAQMALAELPLSVFPALSSLRVAASSCCEAWHFQVKWIQCGRTAPRDQPSPE